MNNFQQKFHGFFAFILKADRTAMTVLARALVTDHERKALARNRGEGFTRNEVRILGVLFLCLSSLGMAGFSIFMRSEPGIFSFFALLALLFMATTVSLGYVHSMMLADEGFRVIASWPVSSRTFLAARLCEPLGYCVAATTLVCGPAALVLMVFSGVPVLTGLVFLLICILSTMALFVFMACFYCVLMEVVSPEETGIVVLLGYMGATIFGSGYLERSLEGLQTSLYGFAFSDLPQWLPITWLASLIEATHAPANLALAFLGLFCLLALPYLLFQWISVFYTANLSKSRVHRAKGRGKFWLPLLRINTRSPAHYGMAVLCLAHGRADWRFRSQLVMIPILLMSLAGGAFFGDLSAVFVDPLNHDTFFHPAIGFIVVIAFPPILALPMLATSKDWGAAWIMKASPVGKDSFAAAQRHVMRVVFVFPLLFISALGYLYYQAPFISVLVHLTMMGLIAEVMVCGLQNLFSDYPFALPNDDEAFMMNMLPVFLVYEAIASLMGILVFHTVYRWWWSLLLGAFVLIFMRQSFIKGNLFFEKKLEMVDEPEREEVLEVDSRVEPLIWAIKDGRFHTVKALIKDQTILALADENGKTIEAWLRESKNEDIKNLVG